MGFWSKPVHPWTRAPRATQRTGHIVIQRRSRMFPRRGNFRSPRPTSVWSLHRLSMEQAEHDAYAVRFQADFLQTRPALQIVKRDVCSFVTMRIAILNPRQVLDKLRRPYVCEAHPYEAFIQRKQASTPAENLLRAAHLIQVEHVFNLQGLLVCHYHVAVYGR